jgi:transposase
VGKGLRKRYLACGLPNQNLSAAVQRLLDRFPGALQQVTEQLAAQVAQAAQLPLPACPTAAPAPPPAPAPALLSPPTSARLPACESPAAAAAPRMTPGTARTHQRFAQGKELQAQGLGQRAIARRLGWHRRTVQRYMGADQAPVRGVGAQSQTRARAYIPYLRRRWAEGVHNRVQLWQEVRQQGYGGSYLSVYRLLVRLFGPGRTAPHEELRPESGKSQPLAASPMVPEVRPLTARQARWLLVQPVAVLSERELQQRAWLLEACPAATTAAPLVERFVTMVRERQGAELEAWLADALSSGVAELRNFAIGIKRDFGAVQAGLTLIWSQGQVEGQVNRLKMVKRMMFGRAKFDLLRLRVLAT